MATFHTHPFMTTDGNYQPQPSIGDLLYSGFNIIPGMIQSHAGMYYYGPPLRWPMSTLPPLQQNLIGSNVLNEECTMKSFLSFTLTLALVGCSNSPSECTVARVAERHIAVWYPDFDSVKYPPVVQDKGQTWQVHYELPKTAMGGTPVVVIEKGTLRVLSSFQEQ